MSCFGGWVGSFGLGPKAYGFVQHAGCHRRPMQCRTRPNLTRTTRQTRRKLQTEALQCTHPTVYDPSPPVHTRTKRLSRRASGARCYHASPNAPPGTEPSLTGRRGRQPCGSLPWWCSPRWIQEGRAIEIFRVVSFIKNARIFSSK